MKRTLASAAAALLAVTSLTAEPDFSVEGVRVFGGDFGVTLDGWKLIAGAGWESEDFGRDRWSGEPLPAPPAGVDYGRTLVNGTARLLYTWDFGGTRLWAGSGAYGHGDLGSGPAAAGAFPDLGGNTFGFATAGLTRDHRVRNDHGVVSGTNAEALVEIGPAAVAARGTDYHKFSFRGAHLMPLWDLPGPGHVFSGTLANRLNFQWIDGAQVPISLLEPTQVRGYYRLLDTKFRSVATTELRVGLPSVWGPHDLVPVVFAFAEGGWYHGYADAAASSDRSGWLASTGAGFGLSIWGFTTPTLTAALPLIGEAGLWWKFHFNLRF